ncbi:hypothetical protein F383_03742 [Gossypium arboreum]|uniref:Uncharacterized protein n=1 Tax=Gossypium arboreum TaxID=29729 RepID=A0A0B0NGS3_GOSAR|nr:hypothetical protein F383_03742 [Gossypium arboreum]
MISCDRMCNRAKVIMYVIVNFLFEIKVSWLVGM